MSCITVKPVMFLLSLLLLWVAIQATSACICEEIDWEAAMCPESNKTVANLQVTGMLNISSLDCGNVISIYQLRGQKYKEGPNKLGSDSLDNFMILDNCSIPWTRSTPPLDSWYMIAGDTDTSGLLHVSQCGMEKYGRGFFSKTGKEDLQNLLLGHLKPTCQDDS